MQGPALGRYTKRFMHRPTAPNSSPTPAARCRPLPASHRSAEMCTAPPSTGGLHCSARAGLSLVTTSAMGCRWSLLPTPSDDGTLIRRLLARPGCVAASCQPSHTPCPLPRPVPATRPAAGNPKDSSAGRDQAATGEGARYIWHLAARPRITPASTPRAPSTSCWRRAGQPQGQPGAAPTAHQPMPTAHTGPPTQGQPPRQPPAPVPPQPLGQCRARLRPRGRGSSRTAQLRADGGLRCPLQAQALHALAAARAGRGLESTPWHTGHRQLAQANLAPLPLSFSRLQLLV